MKRRGFLGIFGTGAAAAFVPFVVPGSMQERVAPAAAPAVLPPAKAWVFQSHYRNLWIQLTPQRVAKFSDGCFRTEDPKEAEAVREALRGMKTMHSHPNVAWEV